MDFHVVKVRERKDEDGKTVREELPVLVFSVLNENGKPIFPGNEPPKDP